MQEPAGTGHYTALVTDSFSGTGPAAGDEWSFEAESGDRVSARLEAVVGASSPRLRLLNATGTAVYSMNGGTDGVATMNAVVITTPGTYRVQVYTDSAVSAYSLRFDLGRGINLEQEPNDSIPTATPITPLASSGQFTFSAAGLAHTTDTAGDFFAVGQASPGSTLTTLLQLAPGGLTAADVSLQVFESHASDRSLDLNGTTYATVPHNTVFDAIETGNAVTLEAWVYIRSWPSGYFPIFDKYRAVGDWGWVFSVENGGGGLSFWSGSSLRASSNVTPTLNAWHHVAVAYEHAANSVRFYVDGQLVATRTSPGPLNNTDTDPAYIGFSPSGGDEYANGLIGEIRLWNRALSTAEIQVSYAAETLSPASAGLVGLWRFDEGTGLTSADATSYGNNATLGGGNPARVPNWGSGIIRALPAVTGTSLTRTFPVQSQAWLKIAAANNRSLAAGYYLTGSQTDSTNLNLVSTSLPAPGGSTTDLIQSIILTFDDELNPASANTVTNYEVRNAGLDGTFNTGDDIVYVLGNPAYLRGTTLTLPLQNGPLQPGKHRLTLGVGLRDRAGNPLSATATTEFTVQQLDRYVIENQSNDTFATATNIGPLAVDGTSFAGGGRGNLNSASDTDYFNFQANAGDRIILTTESPTHGDTTGLYYYLYGPAQGTALTQFAAPSNGSDQGQIVAPTTGTYYVRVDFNHTYYGEYRFAVAVIPGTMSLESEGNDTIGVADALAWTMATGTQSASVAGVLNYADTQDCFALGYLDVGTQIALTATKPPSSNLVWILDILDASSTSVISATAGTATLLYTVPPGKAGNHYARIRPSSGASLTAQYRLGVTLTDATRPTITGDTLPTQGATVTDFFGNFGLTFSENLQAAGVNDSSSYDLRAAGPDGLFNTADDVLYTVVPASTYATGLSATFRLSDGPLQPGSYRFQAKTTLLDIYGNALAAPYTRTFSIAGVTGYTLESRSNDSFATATSVPMVADGTGFLARGRGNISSIADVDYFSFTANAGDRVIITTENPTHADSSGMFYYVHGPSLGTALLQFAAPSNGSDQAQFVAATTGTYYVRVEHNYTTNAEYRFAVAVFPEQVGLESETNDTAGGADAVTWVISAGSQTTTMAGVVNYGDPGDWFALGFQDVATTLTLSATKPPSSNLSWILDVIDSSGVVASSAVNAPTLAYTIPAAKAGNYFARIRASTGADLLAQYRLTISLGDTSAPTITSSTLPAEGATVTDFFGDFQLSFSETLRATTVNDPTNYDLRAAGTDGVFGTGDDVAYNVALASPYSSGLSTGLRVTDGPLQPGSYRFQAKTGLLDLYGNPLAGVYTRTFSIAGVPGFILESRSNDTFATATSASPTGEGSAFGGSWRDGVEYLTGGNGPTSIAAADLNNDGKLDLISANYDGGTISVLTGNGDGTFATPATTYPAPNNPFKLAVGDLNGDGRADVVVTRRNGSSVRVFMNHGTGGFVAPVDLTTPGGPMWLVLRDLNGDGSLDIATANYDASSLTIFYNNGTGTFGPAATLPVTGTPYSIAAGDLNGDGRVDLAIGTATDRAVKVFYRQADGSYAAGGVLTWGATDYVSGVAIGDLNGDGRADLLAITNSTTEVRRWDQQANGTLLDGTPLGFGETVTGYSVMVKDYNGDGLADVVVGRNNNVAVFENLGGGTFASPLNAPTARSAREVVIADFNGDGRPDIATTAQQGNAVKILLGRGIEPLTADGSGFIGRVRGQTASAGSDVDYYSFSAKAGNRVLITAETPTHADATGRNYYVSRPDQVDLVNFVADSNGTAQTQFIAPVTGTYFIRVQTNWTYSGEYRVTIAVSTETTGGLESETNNTLATADPLTFTPTAGAQSTVMLGVVNYGDPGDWNALGSLAEGTQISVAASKPPSSGLSWILEITNASGAVAAAGAPNGTPVIFMVPLGGAGAYYARIRAAAGADMSAQYRLAITLTDTQGPAITSSTLPADGTSNSTLLDRFSLTFTKDMDPTTVNNVANYDLRLAGADNIFDTADDVIIPLVLVSPYSSGTTVSLRTANSGALPLGSYRFRALAGLKDKFGNALSPIYTRLFSMVAVGGYTSETEDNGTRATAVPLAMDSSQPDLLTGGGRGYLFSSTDTDYWSFNLQAGDRAYLIGETNHADGTGLTYLVSDPANTTIASVTAPSEGSFTIPLFTAAQTGIHTLRVTHNWSYTGEYRFRVFVLRGSLQSEAEPNDSLATATAMTLTPSGNNTSGSMHGVARVAGDLDDILLGTLQAGTTVFLSTRQPPNSPFVPVVSLYDAAGNLIAESSGGRAGDPVAQVPISVTGVYFALVRTSGATSGLASEYILDVLVVPTAGISFPNLQVTSLTAPPATGLKSGDATAVTFRVDNLGNVATGAVTWVDRVVLSTDTIYGNADDIELGVFSHTGPLNATSNYVVNATPVTIPDGISGSYYVIVRTDHTNTVTEFVLEGDNETVSDTPIAITLADYPDLVIENLVVTPPDSGGQRTATWTLANRGTGTATAGFSERFLVRNTGTSAVPVNTVTPIPAAIGPGGTVPRQATFTVTSGGNYAVEVTADAGAERYEYNAAGHVAAENNNVGSATFSITQLYTVTVAADPVSGGLVGGGGTFAEGTNVTVTATPTPPYIFLGWFEGAYLRSVNASYSAPLLGNRTLTAHFGQPTYTISTQVNPAGAGVVNGGGLKTMGSSVSLTASALPGYLFANWSEGATNLGAVSPLTFTAAADRTIVANFTEANPTHVVTTATAPAAITTVGGAGTYTNGQTATITAPATVTAGNVEYLFERFVLNGAPVSTTASLTKTFSTLDPPTLAYVAEYKSQGVKPTVAAVTTNTGARAGLGANLQITVRFDRTMNQAVKPLVELLSTNSSSIPTVPANGIWTAADTYVVPVIVIGAANGGDYRVRVSQAQDTQSRTIDPAEVYNLTIDVTAPPLPTLAAGPVTATSAAVTWSGYSPPADLASFRVYRSTTSFTSLAGLSPIDSVPASARSYVFTNLAIETDYFVAVVPADDVGNTATTVTPFTVRIASTVPPAVDFTVTALTSNSARISWAFDATGQIGFAGFKIYRQTTAFSSITGLTPIATLTTDKTSYDDLNLDRSLTHYYAVVGYNTKGESLTNVVSKPWSDPLANTLTTDFTASDPVLIINQPLTVTSGATFTVPAGTIVAFGPGASLTIQSGRLIADGTIYAPVVFTSLADVDNTGPTRGSWNGITLSDSSHSSTLRNVWVKYGKGLSITAGTHTVTAFGAVWNDVGGLRLSGAASLTTNSAYLANNAVGASTGGSASLTLAGSVVKNNTINASAAGTGVLDATGTWWGTADAGAIAALISGPVITIAPQTGEPVLTSGVRSADGSTSTGVANLSLRLASMNASSYRLSEDSTFTGVLFVNVPRDPLSPDQFNSSSWLITFPLSAGSGTKTVYAQFRSPTGAISAPVSFTTNYVSAGPVIATFSLIEGQTINRPLTVNATVTSALPIASLTFYVDNVIVATSTTTSLSRAWDMRSLTPGAHAVRLVATDTSANVGSRNINVVFNPTPPPRPVITAPANGFKTTATTVTVTGTAEPLAALRVTRNGAVVATLSANAAGAFSAPNVALVEGSNELAATAYDAIGATSSPSVFVNSDTGAPAAVTLLPVTYNANEGVFLDWDLPTAGEVPVLYRVFWSNTSFTSPAQATGQSAQLLTSYTVLKNLPDGIYYFGIVGYDEAGNASALSNLRSFTVDLTPPSFAIAYTQAMPVGPGALGITVTASEALSAAPLLLMKPDGGDLLAVTLAPAGGNNYTVSFPVTPLSARSGTAALGVSGTDLAGNTFTGAPSGPPLVFDVTKPTGIISPSISSPIQNTSNVTLGVSLVLSEAVKPGTQPTLSFSPPVGSSVPITLSGSGTSWSGQLTVTPAMDNGLGTFLLSATDAVSNVGTVITSGEKLELYTTPTPPPAAIPTNVTIEPLQGGYIRLTWNAANNAQSYRLYREPGPGAAAPTTLVTSNISGLTIDDLPPVDGTYRYAVTSFRLGSESGPSGVRATTSDRTPPPAPVATTAGLGVSGINVSWTPGAGEPAAKWIVYRNNVAIRTLTDPSATSFRDSPPRGVMTYVVAAADTLGNEARGPAAVIELFVGAVANLKATVDPETGTMLTWASADPTTVGYHVYRNGTKQTASPITTPTFSDSLPSASQPVTYKVTAVNASAQESAPRVVVVQPLAAAIRLNPTADGDLRSVARYFDTYTIDITVGANASAPVTFATGEIIRTVTGETPAQITFPLPSSVGVNETKTATAVIAAPNAVGIVQGTATTLTATADDGGSTVAYRFIQDFDVANPSGLMVQLSSTAPPLAGGLSDFTVQVFNNGHAPADLVVSRAGNTQPGDLEMLITNAAGVLVSTTAMQASVPGVLINAQGDAFLRVEPGASASIPFTGVLVPESLSAQAVTFRARIKAIYHALGTTLQRTAGPLEGTMESTLLVTPYYATATTAQSSYSDNQPVMITGTAIDRATNLPAGNVTVRIGIRVRGAVIYQTVQTDANGAFSYAYTPSLGLSGELVIWAAHPDVVDQLNQAKVSFYRIFTNPSRVTAVMSKNDKLDFDVALLNPSDVALGGPSVTFRGYRVENGAEVIVPGLTGTARGTLPATLGPKTEPKIGLRLQADLTVPDDALFEFTITTPQGASTKLAGTVSFRPALAVLTVTSPAAGYAEAGVSHGQLKSVDVTVMNTGLRALTNAKITPPANIPWMQVNLAVGGDGTIPLNDIPIGGSRSFTVVFSPPADQAVGFYSDFLTISGDNSTGSYRLNLFATVTSAEKGAALFTVTNTFSQPVPNTSIWLRNRALGTEVGPVLTDVNGTLRVADLMEGDWQWKTQAAGHGATQGVVTIIPDDTVSVETELFVTMVTVKFSVVPVPFTDYYEIKIEQTFQTRTPIPNMVLSPPHQSLTVEAGWSGTLLYTLRNEGLRSVFDVKVYDANLPTMRVTPLVTFIPEIKAQETIQIPVFFEYFGPASDTNAMLTSGSMARVIKNSPGSTGPTPVAMRAPGLSVAAQSGGGGLQEFLDCYKEFKYGTITFKAEGGISSLSGQPYTVGVNATIDVDELLALVCDGNCPPAWTGGGVLGQVAHAACGKLVSRIVSSIGRKTSVIDTVCKASNIIKAIACAAAQLPTGTIQNPPQGGGGGGPAGSLGGNGFPGSGWDIVGRGCFAAGTPVSLPDGSILPIEQVSQGMKLRASTTGRSDAVGQVMLLSSDHVRELTYRCRDRADAPTQSLRLTHDHRVWVDGRGWTFAAAVLAGDWLHGADGKLYKVLANTRLPGRHDVYGLRMDRDNVVYAGGILAEDQCFKAAPQLSVSPQNGGGL